MASGESEPSSIKTTEEGLNTHDREKSGTIKTEVRVEMTELLKRNDASSDNVGGDRMVSSIEAPPLNHNSADYDNLMDQVKQHVLKNWVMAEDYFQDYDPLRTGYMPASDFRKGLKAMGLQPDWTDAQLAVIENHYIDPDKPGVCDWTRFLHDAEKAFDEDESGKSIGNSAVEKQALFEKILQSSKQGVEGATPSVEPCFHNFDRNNTGYVTIVQSKECLLGIVNDEEMKTLEDIYTDDLGFRYLRFLQDFKIHSRTPSKGIRRNWRKAKKHLFRGIVSPQLSTSNEKSVSLKESPFILQPVEWKKPAVEEHDSSSPLTTNRPDNRFSISYESLVWFVFLLSTSLCLLDHFIRNGDVMFGRSGKHPSRLRGSNFGQTLTNIVWAVTARVIITSQNMMFYTTLWCFPNMLSEIAPRWVAVNGIRDVHLKMHRLTGIFMIAIPSVAHVLVIFVPPLIDGTSLKYYPPCSFNYSKSPDHLNWSKFWDPAAVDNWTFNDHKGVHLTSDEIYRFVLMIVLFCFLFPLSRSEYLNNRSYSTAITLHVLAGVWYSVDNIRKITHSLSHVFNLPMLIIWCIDRFLCIVLYRKNKGHVVRKDVIGNNKHTVVFMKLDSEPEPGVGDVYYLHHSHKLFGNIIPQRAHPFTSFSNHGQDLSWDVGFVMTVMEDHEQWTLPWTRWIGAKEQVPPFHMWGPYRSSVWQLHKRLLHPSNETQSPPHFFLLASGSGFGYLLDVLGILAHKTCPSNHCQGKAKPKVDIYYSVRSKAFCHFFQNYVNELMKKIKQDNTATVTFNCYVTGKAESWNTNNNPEEDTNIHVFNCRLDFEKVLRYADKKTFISFVGRPAIADAIEKICQKNGLNLIKDYTNGQRGNQDGQVLKKYLKISFWIVLLIVAMCLIAHLFIDVQHIKQGVQKYFHNKTNLGEA